MPQSTLPPEPPMISDEGMIPDRKATTEDKYLKVNDDSQVISIDRPTKKSKRKPQEDREPSEIELFKRIGDILNHSPAYPHPKFKLAAFGRHFRKFAVPPHQYPILYEMHHKGYMVPVPSHETVAILLGPHVKYLALTAPTECGDLYRAGRFVERAVDHWFTHMDADEFPPMFVQADSPDVGQRRLPFNYPATASLDDCPTFKEILSRATNAKALAAFIGSIFLDNADRQQYLYLSGDGRNGKSRLMAMLRYVMSDALFGTIASPNTKGDSGRFMAAQFFGKRLVVVSELDDIKTMRTGIFKSITGGDPVAIERKGKDPFIAELTCKVIIVSNEPAEVSRMSSDARRLIYCHLGPITGPTIPERQYDDMLKNEAPHIIRYCMDQYMEMAPDLGEIPIDKDANECAFQEFELSYASVFDQFLEEKPTHWLSLASLEPMFVMQGWHRKSKARRDFYTYCKHRCGADKVNKKEDGVVGWRLTNVQFKNGAPGRW